MNDLYELLRSSWGLQLFAHALYVIAGFATAGLGLFIAERASWRDERGYGLVEVAVALLIIIVALVLLVHFL